MSVRRLIDGPFGGEQIDAETDGDVVLDDLVAGGYQRYTPISGSELLWWGWVHPDDL
tara:strand:+ start:133 stop:303 length:171 start_codon:yes stop_codon:yes gene_type:complete